MSVPASQLGLLKPALPQRPRWREYLALTKPRVVLLMLFTVLVGMLMAPPAASLSWTVWLGTPLGIALVAGAAAALNHLIDQRIDALMARTRGRPMPRGRLNGLQVLLFALLLGVAGSGLLLATTNGLCTLLTLASLVGYAGVYSLYLKHATPQNIVIGGAAGATPPLLGWVAVSGSLDPGALVLFLIIFIWTPPHFWALAIHRRDDYARAEVPMLPVIFGIPYTTRRIFGYTLALVAISLLPAAIAMSGPVYLAGALLLGLRFLRLAWQLRSDPSLAMPTFRYSIVYLGALFALLLIDRGLGLAY